VVGLSTCDSAPYNICRMYTLVLPLHLSLHRCPFLSTFLHAAAHPLHFHPATTIVVCTLNPGVLPLAAETLCTLSICEGRISSRLCVLPRFSQSQFSFHPISELLEAVPASAVPIKIRLAYQSSTSTITYRRRENHPHLPSTPRRNPSPMNTPVHPHVTSHAATNARSASQFVLV